ncbi:hypothetical protein A6D6_01880 [Alcanivorax xiamenensis]|uniref:Bacteriocin-protection, YdeI or OmpD-Associated n=1 Tax=Alcanivorax xiamenensis TaxID=1177156 RepID=A0ABQ6Y8T7_9GAMM|nr:MULTISPECIES: YdeI/OmpD-associated family protein [Alcanivoracaceae]KAF0806062.1 hypothetical protein A6D6_01880 [Alcanivorax xiamenensis]SOC25614.1 uncharacterized protein DUF1905 [Alloalcanivorax xenomutans]
MLVENTKSQFEARLLCPKKQGDSEPWAFVVLPREVSTKLPRRGRTSVDGTLNGHAFQVLLEPDGRKSHWLRIGQPLMETSGTTFGDVVRFEISPVAREPEPEVPMDLREALQAAPEAREIWEATTTLARVDWIHWITTAKQVKTRAKRINDACDMLASGKKRVCCFDPSGFYSKAIRAPEAAD